MYRTIWCVSLLVLCAVGSASAAFDPLTDPALIGWWKCDEGQGSTVSDSSPNHRDGTFINGDPLWTTGFRGEGTGIRLINPTLVQVPAPGLTLTHATMAGWFLPNGTQPDWASIIMHRGTGLAHGLNMLADRHLAYHWADAQSTWDYRGNAYYAADEWTHCAVTVEPTKAVLYINGVAMSTNAVAHSAATWDNPFYFGGDNNSEHAGRRMNGSLDDVMFFSRALTAAEIKSLVPPRLKAYKPDPADGAMNLLPALPLFQWTKGDTAIFHNVWFGTSPDELVQVQANSTFPMYWHALSPLVPGTTYYWRVDEIDGAGTVHIGDVWSATAMPLTAHLPVPADGAQGVFPVAALSWAPGATAGRHQVYLSTDATEVENGDAAADMGKVDTPAFEAGILRASTTYYWRVDEIEAGDTVQKGKVWSFTTGGEADKALWQWWLNISGTAIADLTGSADYPANPSGSQLVDAFESPENWGDNYGQRILGWLKPPQDGEYTFWIAGDDAQQLWLSTDENPANVVMIASVPGWTPYRDFDNTGGGTGDAATQKSAAIPLKAGQKYYIEALGKEGGGGDSTSVAWQGPGIAAREVIQGKYVDTFVLPPLQAFSPNPANGAVDVIQSPTLSWNAGEKAQQHEVYFGDDLNAVAAADTSSSLFRGRQTGTSFDAGSLEWGKTYYWRIDEVAGGDPESPWTGPVWSFTTADFLPVDDFESYDDVEGTDTRIYENWLDGWTTNDNGSTVGNWDPPFCEQTIVHGGRQSMPFDYNNLKPPFYSEAYREFAPLQNWTGNGVTDLSLWIRGYPATAGVNETAPGTFTVSGEGADIWGTVDQFTFVYKTLSGDGTLVARVVSNGTGSSRWAKGGVMIRDSFYAGSASAQMCLTGGDGNGAAFQNRASTDLDMNANDGTSNTTAAAAVAPPYWVKIERKGDTFTGSMSPDGTTWTQLGIPQFVSMTAPVYIGLCVTSHAAGEYRTFEFDNVATTGNVSGAWQTTEVGLVRNSASPLYVTVEDSTGKKATVINPDPAAVNVTDWTEWKVPLADLADVNLTRVKRLYLGVGDKSTAGHGKIFVDDIRVTRPAPTPDAD